MWLDGVRIEIPARDRALSAVLTAGRLAWIGMSKRYRCDITAAS
jgi:hypothetical protein